MADRIPAVTELAVLPDDWVEAFQGTQLIPGDLDAVVVPGNELLETFSVGEPDLIVAQRIAHWSDESHHLGHDEAKSALVNAFLLGRESHAGVHQLYELIVRRFSEYVLTVRPREAEREIASLIDATAAIAQRMEATPVVRDRMPTPEEFMAGAKVLYSGTFAGDTCTGQSGQGDTLAAATEEEIESFLASFTREDAPGRFISRLGWMKADPPAHLYRHVVYMVTEAMSGDYTAEHAIRAIGIAHRHHFGDSVAAARTLLAHALGFVLGEVSA